MNTASVQSVRRSSKVIRYTRRFVKRAVLLGLFAVGAYFVPWLFLGYAVCGLLDVARNDRINLRLLDHYFFGNGIFTWLLSPFNLFVDVLTLPYRNRGVYRKEDLPPACQEEIESLIRTMYDRRVCEQLAEKMEGKRRGMMFFKWYGKNIETSIEAPEFHRRFAYVRTIGVSVFNTRQYTNEHFGPLRLTLRVLYNLNDTQSEDVYIDVGQTRHLWRDNKLFIFDDTLLHQSVNQSDEMRFCMFVDILRPSPVRPVLSVMVTGLQLVLAAVNSIFYKKWTPIK